MYQQVLARCFVSTTLEAWSQNGRIVRMVEEEDEKMRLPRLLGVDIEYIVVLEWIVNTARGWICLLDIRKRVTDLCDAFLPYLPTHCLTMLCMVSET